MPLPQPGSVWPPRQLDPILSAFRRWSAWYSGDVDELIAAYGGSQHGRLVTQRLVDPRRPASRIMWGDPLSDGADDDRVHVPLASDLCAASAELCYADPPQFASTNEATQTRITEYVDAGLVDVAAGGHEIGAALGGHYLQAVLPETGIAQLESVAYDGAWPVFTRGRLQSVAFWWELEVDTAGRVWRHFESHELDNEGVGIIRHAIYLGTRDNVGDRMTLDTRPETAYLADLAGGETWSSGTPGMDVVHIPGRTPQRLWRADPIGRHLGRSVFQGIEGALGKLDEAYTSWMRDVDLGRSRLLLADWLLQTTGPGKGATFDLDSRLIVPVALPAAIGTDNRSKPVEMIQFAIRVQEHMQTCQELTEVILRAVSFSAQTFGEDEEGNAQTATAVMSKDSRSMRTRAKMLTAERVGLQQIVRKMLAMDQARGMGMVADPELLVTFPDGGQETILQLAQTAQALRAAEAASDETLVRMVHPDWSETEIGDEVMAIRAGSAARMAITVPGDNVIGSTSDPNAGAGFTG